MLLPKKTIKIFLFDGDPNGRLTCELSNWTGKAYKIPRNKIKDCSDREDLSSTGVTYYLARMRSNPVIAWNLQKTAFFQVHRLQQ